jgi:hypothetical protein
MTDMQTTTNVDRTAQGPREGKEEDDITIVIEKTTALLAIEVGAVRLILEARRIALLYWRASQ